jgi:hypothetical protein
MWLIISIVRLLQRPASKKPIHIHGWYFPIFLAGKQLYDL